MTTTNSLATSINCSSKAISRQPQFQPPSPKVMDDLYISLIPSIKSAHKICQPGLEDTFSQCPVQRDAEAVSLERAERIIRGHLTSVEILCDFVESAHVRGIDNAVLWKGQKAVLGLMYGLCCTHPNPINDKSLSTLVFLCRGQRAALGVRHHRKTRPEAEGTHLSTGVTGS